VRSLTQQDLTIRTDWQINGHDYDHNFTLNICEPVLSDYSDVVDVSDRTNVSGYYIDSKGDKISIGCGLCSRNSLTIVERVDFRSSGEGACCWNTRTDPSLKVVCAAQHFYHSCVTEIWKLLYYPLRKETEHL